MQPHQLMYEKCIQELKLDQMKIFECFNGTQGTHLQLLAEIDTLEAHINGVPSVTYDGQPDLNDDSLTNFEAVVISKLQERKFVP
jgi:hypothetical protein